MSENFDLPNISVIERNNADYSLVSYNNATSLYGKKGQAALPVLARWIEIPDCDSVIIVKHNIVLDTIDVGKFPVIAKQPSEIKSVDNRVFVVDTNYYAKDIFVETGNVTIEKTGKMNQTNLALLTIRPCRYNPKQNLLEVVRHIDFELIFVNVKKKSLADPTIPPKYVIVTDKIFASALKPFTDWKKTQGFNVVEAYTQDIGATKEEIYSYLKNDYLTSSSLHPSADYVLIVGDTSVVPTFLGDYVIDNYPKHYTDFYYTDYTNDMLPDVYLGRMSVKDTVTLTNIITKTLNYEQFRMDSTDFLNRTLMVAGKETESKAKFFTNGQLDYIKQYFVAKTDTAIYYNPASAEAQNKQQIRNNISEGNGWVLYTGHGIDLGWQNPAYRVQDIDTAMNNIGKYGIYINNCCHAGKFYSDKCFTSSLVSAQNRGAVVSVGACDYTTWDEDFYWSVGAKVKQNKDIVYDNETLGVYDKLFHTHFEPYQSWIANIGQMVCAGNLAVEQSLSDWCNYYWEIYNIQGDPSLMPYVGMPLEFDVEIKKTVNLGEKNITFYAPPYTFASLTKDFEIISVCQSDSTGKITLSLEDIVTPTDLCLTLTNQFYKPFVDSLSVICKNKSFIVLKDVIFAKKDGGENEEDLRLGQGEQYNISFTIVNAGDKNFTGAGDKIKISSSFADFVTDTVLLPSLQSQQSFPMNDVFACAVHSGIENLSQAQFTFEIISSDGTTLNDKNIVKEIIAPKIEFTHVAMNRTDKEIIFDVELVNEGMQKSIGGYITLECNQTSLLCEEENKFVGAQEFLDTSHVYFHLKQMTDTISNMALSLIYTDGTYTLSKEVSLDFNENKEGFEDGFTRYDWSTTQDYPWIIDNEVSHSGKSSARSSNKLNDGKKSQLILEFSTDVSINVEFYVKVSSEKDYDKLKFFIDKQEIFALDGETSWLHKRYDISSGHHTFCFSYEKDKELADGADAAWLDDFIIRIGQDSMAIGTNQFTDGDVFVIPNPAKDMVKITNLTPNADIKLFDAVGQIVCRQKSLDSETYLDIKYLKSGVYCVMINDSLTKKLLIIK